MRQKAFDDGSLYLVTGAECSLGRATLDVVSAAIRGGVDIVQMREKNASRPELVELGRSLKDICKTNDVVFMVNDDPYLAREVRSDGVHLGQEDVKKYGLPAARELVGTEGIIGLSTHSVRQAKDGAASDVDYIAFGPVFPTKTKDYFIGSDGLPEVLALSSKPVVVIGGINGENLDKVLSLGARNVAMIRHITEAPDVESRVREIKEIMLRRGSAASKVNVRINGKTESLDKVLSIGEFVGSKGLKPERVIVEHNNVIVPREKWRDVLLSAGDNVEILSFVGGG